MTSLRAPAKQSKAAKEGWIASSLALLAMTELGGLPASHPEDGEAEDQQDQEDHDEDIEQEAGDIR